jgi:hypothetical protein
VNLFEHPLISFDAISRGDLNDCLIAWQYRMGPWERPNYREIFHGLRHDGQLVAVCAAGDLIRETCAGFTRDEAVELGRVCAARRDLCRVVLRLWREFVFPALCRAHGWSWVVSYQDAVMHRGDLYRFDGWVRAGESRSGTDARSGRKGRSKVIWAWCADRRAREEVASLYAEAA